MDERLANGGGFLAIILWSSTSLLLSLMSDIPAFLNASILYFISFFVLSLRWVWKKQNPLHFFYKKPLIILWTVYGLGLNFICLVISMRMIPVIEANLLNYLWPMMSIVLASFLPDRDFKKEYIIGGLIGFAGIYVIVSRGEGLAMDIGAGHVIMFFGALAWAIYSVGTRLLKNHPSDYITIGFFYSAILFLAAHFILERDEVWHPAATDFIFLGILATTSGVSYMLWDHAMKHGNMQLLNVSSNSMPLLSTLYLIAFGKAAFSLSVVGSALLIMAGTMVASKDRVLKVLKRFRPKGSRRPIA